MEEINDFFLRSGGIWGHRRTSTRYDDYDTCFLWQFQAICAIPKTIRTKVAARNSCNKRFGSGQSHKATMSVINTSNQIGWRKVIITKLLFQ
jgi:hypothetical protein